MKETKIPELRFKDDNGKDYPDWEEKSFLDVFESIPTKKYQILSSEVKEIGCYEVVDQGQEDISGYSDNKEKLFKNVPIIIYGDHTTVVKYRENPFIIGADGVKLLIPKISNLDLQYIYYALVFRNISPEGYKRHFSILKEINLPYPSLKEQIKISNFFSKIDERIKLQEEKINNLEKLKKGFMQKIFSQEIRFKDDNGDDYPDWEEKKLGNILKETSIKTNKNNQYEILSSTVKGLYSQKEYFNKEVASKNNIGYKVLKLNQIVLSPQNLWMGNINLNSKYEIGIVSPSYKTFDIDKKNNAIFIEYLLKTDRALYEYNNASEQGASIVRRNLNMELFKDISFKIPSLEEQTKIASFLSAFNKKIELEKEMLENWKALKKGLLQKMFI